MKDGQMTVFVEVRFRQSSQFGGAAASVTPAKQQKLLQTALCGLPAIMGALILWIAGSMW
jgi:putative endonuclease